MVKKTHISKNDAGMQSTSNEFTDNTSEISISDVFNTNDENFKKMMDVISNPNPENKKYTEKHHIIPKCVYRANNVEINNDESNLVELSIKNHFLVHYYASLCCVEKYKYRFAKAVTKALGRFKQLNIEEELYSIANLVEEARERIRKMPYPEFARKKNIEASLGEKNGFYGKTHTDEVKRLISENTRVCWKNHPEWRDRIVKMNKENAGKKPWNTKTKNANPNEKVKCGNYKLKGKNLPKEWCDASKKGQLKSKKTAKCISKYYKQYKDDGGSISWNDYQKLCKEMFSMGCIT